MRFDPSKLSYNLTLCGLKRQGASIKCIRYGSPPGCNLFVIIRAKPADFRGNGDDFDGRRRSLRYGIRFAERAVCF
jgi:hypothetical protein